MARTYLAKSVRNKRIAALSFDAARLGMEPSDKLPSHWPEQRPPVCRLSGPVRFQQFRFSLANGQSTGNRRNLTRGQPSHGLHWRQVHAAARPDNPPVRARHYVPESQYRLMRAQVQTIMNGLPWNSKLQSAIQARR